MPSPIIHSMITLRQFLTIVTLTVFSLGMTSCSYIQQTNAKNKESLLLAAGYIKIPATSAKQQAALAKMKPYKTIQRTNKGKTFYTYADPKKNALYVGSPANYQAYKKLGLQQSMDNDEILAENEDEAEMMDWGTWYPGF